MGTDIHSQFQKRLHCGAWQDVESQYSEGRHYQLFAVLAGVRNGTGFAGVTTGEPVTPIAEPRGLPSDFEMDTEDDSCHCGKWMGEHSQGWLSGDELLGWCDSPPVVSQCGIVSREEYAAWDRKSQPQPYCRSIWGTNVLVAPTPEMFDKSDSFTHVQIEWLSPLKEELAYFFGEVRRLVGLHGEIRFVFGFDS